METMAQPGRSDLATMIDMSISSYPVTSDQSHLPSAANDIVCGEWPAWDIQMATSRGGRGNSCDTLGSLQWNEEQRHLNFGATGTIVNGAVTRWPSQTTIWPVSQQQDPQPLQSTGFRQQEQYSAPTTQPSVAMSADWQPFPNMQPQIKADEASDTMEPEARRGYWPSIVRRTPRKKREGSQGQSSPTTSTDDSVPVIEDRNEDAEQRRQPAIHPRLEKGKTTYRAKNRVAAKRCREKTKQYEIDLANREKQVTQERVYLDACVTALKNEVLTLKNQILQHCDCDCDMIQGYIARAANGVSIAAARTPSYAR